MVVGFLPLSLSLSSSPSSLPVRSPSPEPGQSEQPNPPIPASPPPSPTQATASGRGSPTSQPRRKAAARAGFSGVYGARGHARFVRLAPGAGGSEGELLPGARREMS
ncbi:hypothetical protein ZWY2020_047538 [Hordeum vulgare]|nr:hypothetical protein ZWY2020_047538 [Hordeum vulgare]